MTMKHVSSRHTPKRWGVKNATSKKVAKLELYNSASAEVLALSMAKFTRIWSMALRKKTLLHMVTGLIRAMVGFKNWQ